MTIHLNNYESYFLDYLEGQLNEAQTASLIRFLEEHPSLKTELDEMEVMVVQPDLTLEFPARKTLKKIATIPFQHVNENNYEEFFVAAAENELPPNDLKILGAFLALNPSLQKDYDLMLKCRLTPDKAVVYHDKQALKRKVSPILFSPARLFYYSAAASVVILIGVVMLFDPVNIKTPVLTNHSNVVEELPSGIEPLQNVVTNGETPAIVLPAIAKNSSAKRVSNKEAIITGAKHESIAEIRIVPQNNTQFIDTQSDKPQQMLDRKIGLSRYFGDIMLAQSIRYHESNEEERATQRLFSHGTQLFRGVFRPDDTQMALTPGNIDWWNVADMGINGISLLTNSNLEFNKERGFDGRVSGFALSGDNINLRRDVDKQKE